jgi:hypothetical protein
MSRLFLFGLISIVVAGRTCVAQVAAPRGSSKQRPIVLAFYHPWYGTPDGSGKAWHKWDSFRFPDRYHPERVKGDGRRDIASMDYPLIGPYDQGDREVVRWHFRLARAAGIDGFICSWWKLDRSDPLWDWQTGLFENVLLPVAKEENFKVAILDECAHYAPSYGQLVKRVTTWLPRYAGQDGYLKINGKPVWYIYQVWNDWLSPEDAARYVSSAESQVGKVFWMFDRLRLVAEPNPPRTRMSVAPEWLGVKGIDCFGAYSYLGHSRDTRPAEIARLYSGFVEQMHRAGKWAALPVLPGHDNTPVEAAPFVLPRRDGQTLKDFLHGADVAKPEIVLVCSFNEWLETTEIEPSATSSDPYLYLKIIAQWRGKSWKTPPLPKGR